MLRRRINKTNWDISTQHWVTTIPDISIYMRCDKGEDFRFPIGDTLSSKYCIRETNEYVDYSSKPTCKYLVTIEDIFRTVSYV